MERFVVCLYLVFNLGWQFVINNDKQISYIRSNWFPGVDIWILNKTYFIYVILRCIEGSEMEKLPKNVISYRTGEYVRWLLMMAVYIYAAKEAVYCNANSHKPTLIGLSQYEKKLKLRDWGKYLNLRGWQKDESGENYITWSFRIFTSQRMLSGWSRLEIEVGWGMWDVWRLLLMNQLQGMKPLRRSQRK